LLIDRNKIVATKELEIKILKFTEVVTEPTSNACKEVFIQDFTRQKSEKDLEK
jgi:hypothetical protein